MEEPKNQIVKKDLEDAVLSFYPELSLEDAINNFKVCCYGSYGKQKCSVTHVCFYPDWARTKCCCNKTDLQRTFALVSLDGDHLFPIGSDCIEHFKNTRLTEECGRLIEQQKREEDPSKPNYFRHQCYKCKDLWRKKDMMTTCGGRTVCTFCFDALPICKGKDCKRVAFDEVCEVKHSKCIRCSVIYEGQGDHCSD